MSNLSASALFNVNGIVAVVTGGGSGIGLMIAKALDANGAKAVYIIGRRKELLESAASTALNGTIIPIVGDVTSKQSLESVSAEIAKEQGYIDVLFANSGVLGIDKYKELGQEFSVKQFKEKMWEPDMDQFSKTLEVNITGCFYTVLAFLELLDEGNKRGREAGRRARSQVVVTSSIAGFSRNPAAGFDYSASKAGATHLVKNLATVLGRFMIRVNTIAPGLYPSDMTAASPALSDGKDATQEGGLDQKQVPLARFGREEEMAGAALFLVSDAGAYLQGNVLLTDGGRLSILPSSY